MRGSQQHRDFVVCCGLWKIIIDLLVCSIVMHTCSMINYSSCFLSTHRSHRPPLPGSFRRNMHFPHAAANKKIKIHPMLLTAPHQQSSAVKSATASVAGKSAGGPSMSSAVLLATGWLAGPWPSLQRSVTTEAAPGSRRDSFGVDRRDSSGGGGQACRWRDSVGVECLVSHLKCHCKSV